jgi:hypothetical protein
MSSNTPYGWSPGLLVLPEVKTANEVRRTGMRQRQLSADPPVLLPAAAESVMEPFGLKPGYKNYGFVSSEGKQLAYPYQTGAHMEDLKEEQAQSRSTIHAAFLIDLFQILIQKPNMTATEVLEWSQEKGDLLAPTMGKQQSELLGPMIGRELDILAAADLLPDMPPELQEAGGRIQIQYEGPLARFQRASEASGFSRTIETTAGLIQLAPDVLDNVNKDETFRSIADINGVPPSWLNDPDAMAQIRAERKQQQDAMLAQEALPGTAAAAKSAAQAKEINARQAA